MRKLTDGQEHVIAPGPQAAKGRTRVVAYREDSETPYVKLGVRPHDGEGQFTETWLTDVAAQELIERLQRALKVLPSSAEQVQDAHRRQQLASRYPKV